MKPADMIGKRWGFLLILREDTPQPGDRHPRVVARCDCGREERRRVCSIVASSYRACKVCRARAAARSKVMPRTVAAKEAAGHKVIGHDGKRPILACRECGKGCWTGRCWDCYISEARGKSTVYPRTAEQLADDHGVSASLVRKMLRRRGWKGTLRVLRDKFPVGRPPQDKGAFKSLPGYTLRYLKSKNCRLPEAKRLRLLAEMEAKDKGAA